jgi:hypothetical protein
VILLGPQRLQATVGDVVGSLGVDGPVLTITAGWQEREMEDVELDEQLRGRSVNLGLYRRAERVATDDPELAKGHGELQRRVKLLRRAYNVRLAHLVDSWIGLVGLEGDGAVLDPEREAVLADVRALDERHLARIRELRREFQETYRPHERPSMSLHREEIRRLAADARVVVVAGGHVAVLLNRMRLFGVGELLEGRTTIAWSAGAMALSPRVVLFHDSPPWGPGNAEAFDTGLGFFPLVVALPHASRRLRLDDRGRVGRFARRFAPAMCVALDAGARVEWDGRGWSSPSGAPRLSEAGGLEVIAA